MKTAVSAIAWKPKENDEVVPVLKRYGVRGIETVPTLASPNPAKYRRYWERKGFSLVAMQSLLYERPDLRIFAEEPVVEKTLTHLQSVMEIAAASEIRILVFGSPKNRSVGTWEPSKVRSHAVSFFRRVARLAQKHSLLFCIEPNASAYGCDFIVTSQEAVSLVTAVSHPNFRVHLDTAVMSMNGEDPVASITTCFPYLEHIHISEPYLAPVRKLTAIDHFAIAACLENLKYGGWVSVEMRKPENSESIESLRETLEAVSLWYA